MSGPYPPAPWAEGEPTHSPLIYRRSAPPHPAVRGNFCNVGHFFLDGHDVPSFNNDVFRRVRE